MGDRELVAWQLGRPPRAFRRVAVRCPYGRPAVTEQAPFDERGRPFPTQFWLTCPHLVAAVSRLEAAGGVERWTRAVEADPELARSLRAADDEQRALRPELDGGIGGGRRGGSLKCLHAHAAFALARPGYSLGERILAELPSRWPDSCCTAQVDVDLARQHWVEGERRVERGRDDRVMYARLSRQIELVVDELRRRVGQTFTLTELAAAYDHADDWVRDLLAESDDGAVAEPGTVADAAFHRYARGALDYSP